MGLLDYLETSRKQLGLLGDAEFPVGDIPLFGGYVLNDALRPFTDSRGDGNMLPPGTTLNRIGRGMEALSPKNMVEAHANAIAGETPEGVPVEGFERLAGLFPAAGAEGGGLLAPAVEKGATTIGTYAGVKSATANKAMLKTAKKLEKAGGNASPGGEIRQQTGWFKDKAGDWKYEIPDQGMRLKDPNEFLTPEQRDTLLNSPDRDPVGVRLGDMVEHPALFGAYPDMADYGVSLWPNLDPHSAWFSPNDRIVNMGVNTGKYTPDNPGFSFSPEHRLTALHEITHGVQHKEGFAQGGSPTMLARAKAQIEDEIARLRGQRTKLHWEGKGPDTPEVEALTTRISDLDWEMQRYPVDDYQGYRNLLGEVEARDVEARADLDHQERRMSTPYASQGVPDHKQIIRKGDAEFSFSEPPPPDIPIAPPLDLSPEARAARAAAQGYNLDAYHSTKADFPAFAPHGKGRNPDAFIHVGDQDAANGRIMSDWNLKYWEDQANNPPYQGREIEARRELDNYYRHSRVLPLKVKAQNPLDMPDLGRWDSESNFLSTAAKEKGWNGGYEPKGWNPPPEVWDDFMALTKAMRDVDYQDRKAAWAQGFADILRKHGYDSVRYPNEIEGKGGHSYMLLDPSQARSRFAEFHPDKVGDPNLLSSVAPGGGLLTAPIHHDTEQRKR